MNRGITKINRHIVGVSRLALAATIVSLGGTAVHAQTKPAVIDSTSLGEIVVTAERRKENLQTTPIAVTSLSQQTLQAQGTTSLLDLNTRVPNLFVGGTGAAGRQAGTFYIRGIGVDTDTLAKEPGVGLYIDDFYYGHTAGSLLSVIDVDSIEILRGPQGTLFGKNTIGGAIRYNTTKPSQDFGGKVEANIGTMRRLDFRGSVNVPVTSDLAVRLSGATLNQDGYIYDIPLKKNLGDDHNDFVRGQARYKSGGFLADLSVDYSRSHNNGAPAHLDIINPSATSSAALYNKIVSGQAPVPFYATQLYAGLTAPRDLYDSRYLAGPYETYATNVGYRMRGFGANLTMAYEVSDAVTFKSLTGYRRNRVFYRVDNDQSPLNWNGNNTSYRLPSFSQEVQALGRLWDGRLHYIGGLYYYRENAHAAVDRMFPGEPDGNQQFDQVITTSKAAFGQVDLELIRNVTFTAGGRYSHDTKEATTTRTRVLLNAAGLAGTPEGATATGFTLPTATRFGPITGSGKATYKNFSPKFAVKVQWTPNIMTYASASRGYRAGGFNNGIAVFNPATGANPNNGILPYGNETDWSYEIGIRSELFDRRLRVNLSAFRSDYRGLQISSSVITGVGSASFIKIDNVGKARLKGLEGEVAFKVTRDLLVGGNFGILDAKYLEIAPTVTAVRLDSPLAGAPKNTYSIYGTYNPKLANGGDIAFNADWGHTAAVYTATSAANAVRLPAYGLLSLSVFYNFPNHRYSVGVTGKNVLDKRYLISAVSLIAVSAGNAGMQYTNVGRPAEVFGTFRVKF